MSRPAPLRGGKTGSVLVSPLHSVTLNASVQFVSVCGHAASLTVHGHAHCDALLEAAELTLVAGNLVDDAAAIVLAGVGRVEVLLDGPTEETLHTGDSEGDRRTRSQGIKG